MHYTLHGKIDGLASPFPMANEPQFTSYADATDRAMDIRRTVKPFADSAHVIVRQNGGARDGDDVFDTEYAWSVVVLYRLTVSEDGTTRGNSRRVTIGADYSSGRDIPNILAIAAGFGPSVAFLFEIVSIEGQHITV